MRRDDRTGVWSVRGDRELDRQVLPVPGAAWQPAAQKVVTASVTDPYSVALAADSTHSQIVDLDDPALAPAGWRTLRKPAPAPAAKAQISELSVRDFSIADDTVPAERRGTYLAFTDPGPPGMTHLRALGDAGVTHLHLLPAFDFATIPEKRADQQQPACDLAALPPDSAEQQECVAAVADTDGYNWGYDPLHYTVPGGRLRRRPGRRGADHRVPADGRRAERRRAAGGDGRGLQPHRRRPAPTPKSVLDQIVPGYYHRLLEDGTVANSTCCANTAPEHAMMGKLVVDSLVTWAKQYKVDGFRFDLMGHHPKANILAVRAALDGLTVARDGVDGKAIYVYGEGWNFGEVANNARFVQATQANMAGTGIGTFNDRLRDAVRGGGPFDANPRVQGFASGLYTDPNGDAVNGSRGRAEGPAAARPGPDQGRADRQPARLPVHRHRRASGHRRAGGLQRLAGRLHRRAGGGRHLRRRARQRDPVRRAGVQAAAGHLGGRPLPDAGAGAGHRGAGQGTGFVTAGTERLRSKSLDRNSYNSGDWFNQIRWDCEQGNGFGAGLPPAPDNEDKWSYAQAAAGRPGAGAGLRGDQHDRRPVRRVAAHPGVVAGVRAGHRRAGAAAGGVPAVRRGRRRRVC